jgi:cytidylate kinase
MSRRSTCPQNFGFGSRQAAGHCRAEAGRSVLNVALTDVRPVVLVTGVPAAGKSTVANQLARRFERGVHVKGDVFRRMVVAGRQEMTSTPSTEAWRQLRLRYRLGAHAADAYHEAGFAVVVQDVVIGGVLAEYVAAIHSRPLVVVVLAPRPDVVANREAARAKAAYRGGLREITVLDRGLRHESPRIGLWLDTSDQRPEETVDEIVARGLEEGLTE